MKWKEFLKPDWRKIVIFIITILPTSYYFLINSRNIEDCFYSLLCFEITHRGDVLNVILKLPSLIPLIISYLVSCLIVYVYDKVKKKRIK
jgi:hypothetical protein